MSAAQWLTVLTNLMLIIAAFAAIGTGIDKYIKYLERKKDEGLKKTVEKLSVDFDQFKKRMEDKFSEVDNRSLENRDLMKELDEDIKYIYKTIVGNNLKK